MNVLLEIRKTHRSQLNQYDFAKIIGVSRSRIRKLELAEEPDKLITINELSQYGRFLNKSLEEMLKIVVNHRAPSSSIKE